MERQVIMCPEVRCETTLGAIANDPELTDQPLLFAVVVDLSEPVPHRHRFLTKLKVIDPSFNFLIAQKSPDLRFSRFCHVNVGSETWETAPRIKNVGDIVRLRRFKFEISDRGELVAFERQTISNWMVFSVFEGSEEHTCAKSTFQKNVGRTLAGGERGRLQDLRCWSRQFFSHYSITSAIWWNPFAASSCESVDLILKSRKNCRKSNCLELVDSRGRNYTLRMASAMRLEKGVVVKLRCVNVKLGDYIDKFRIELTMKSSCMVVPEHFHDARSITPHIEFEEAKKGFCSVVAASRASMKLTSLRQLQDFMRHRPELNINSCFLVEATLERLGSMEAKSLFSSAPFDSQRSSNRTLVHLQLTLSQKDVYVDAHVAEYFSSEMFRGVVEPKGGSNSPSRFGDRKSVLVGRFREFAEKKRRMRLLLQLLLTRSNVPFYKVAESAFL